MAVHPTSLGASVPTTAPGPSRRGHGLPPPTNPSPAPLRPRGLPWTSALGRGPPPPGGLPLRPLRPPRPLRDALGHPFRPARKRPRSPGLRWPRPLGAPHAAAGDPAPPTAPHRGSRSLPPSLCENPSPPRAGAVVRSVTDLSPNRGRRPISPARLHPHCLLRSDHLPSTAPLPG